jgi:D-arabinan exo alpha-(1,3)/(1,5)-arabinofuranosidase (non-reducing end)
VSACGTPGGSRQSRHHDGVIEPVWNPAYVDPRLDSRAATFENPTGARGAGGAAHGGRKGAPNRRLRPGERVVLADIDGPGVVRHIWMTFMPGPPQQMRGVWLEVFYDGASEPSVSVPCLDFFGVPHGRPVAFASALTTMQEGRGFNSWIPMPFHSNVRIELTNSSSHPTILYYQVDYTLQAELPTELGYLHVTFRREMPTTMGRDFVIAEGLRGPGRFLGCNVGVRVIDSGHWYGEGEVKIYRDGDEALPTICGTGLEDYVGSAWGLGAHHAPFAGAPLIVGRPEQPDFVGFYRWHVLDPIMYQQDLKVTIQQIGAMFFSAGQEAELEAYEKTNPAAGQGWIRDISPGLLAWGIAERIDDYCATAYLYCTEPQQVPRLDVAAALAHIERKPYESPLPNEHLASLADSS